MAYDIRPYRPGDETALLKAFHLAFPGRTRSLQEWRWAFDQNPAGRRLFLAFHGEDVVAQYAAIPIRMRFRGAEKTFAQIVDSMVVPEHRRGLKRPGLFVETARAFFEEYGGPDADWVHYGWPVETAWRIGKRFLHYVTVRAQNGLVHELGDGDTALPAGVEVLPRFDEQVSWLYDRCCGSWGISAIRDEAFMNWRFVDHPLHHYTALGVRDANGVLRGTVIVRHGDWVAPNMAIIADWLVPENEPEVAEALLRGALALGRSWGASASVICVPEWSSWFLWFQARRFLVWDSDYFLVSRNFVKFLDDLWLRDHWWLGLAESDLV
ncbi:MAG: GNAT family N-acetyltransferase [Planctomycetota bacterium]